MIHLFIFCSLKPYFEEIFVMNIIRIIAGSLELLCKKNTLGLSFELFDPKNENNPAFISLDKFYKTITYGYGPEILYYGFHQMIK